MGEDLRHRRACAANNINRAMEKVIRKFDSFKRAEAADIEEDPAMTPEERIAVVLELRARIYPDAGQQGLARVYRITQRERS
jgi:hypothetical protein